MKTIIVLLRYSPCLTETFSQTENSHVGVLLFVLIFGRIEDTHLKTGRTGHPFLAPAFLKIKITEECLRGT